MTCSMLYWACYREVKALLPRGHRSRRESTGDELAGKRLAPEPEPHEIKVAISGHPECGQVYFAESADG